MNKKIAAINSCNTPTLLDHIAPLSYTLDIPLIVDDEKNKKLLENFYPQVSFQLQDPITFNYLAKHFDTLIACKWWCVEDKFAFKNFHNKDMKLIFCPHGNSDKGYINKANMLAYSMQDAVMLYGNHMIDLLKKLNIFNRLKKFAIVGNFRLSFYKKYKCFYDKIIQKKIFSKLNKKNKTILYAPTWKDLENSSSFFYLFEKLIKNIPSHINLIIKLHPNLEKKNPLEFYQVYNEINKSNILILDDFPLIYPLLNICDIYLGDFSSVGYDFLYFQKPMFFFDHLQRDYKNNPSLFLYKCGIQITKDRIDNIFYFIENNLDKHEKKRQAQLYKYTFGDEISIPHIRNSMLKIL